MNDERNRKMSASAHAYVRGSTRKFYDWLEKSDRANLPQGPSVWICGDCHVGNLGPVASKAGAVAIQIRDLDQTVIGNPAHDLVRLALSLAMAARGSDLPGVTTALMLERMMEGYGAAIAAPILDDQFDEAGALPQTVKLVMREASRRSWKHLADERIEGVEPSLPLGQRFWPLTAEEREAVDTLIRGEELRRLGTSLRSREDAAKVRLLDAAYWRKGCSSLGRLRLAALVRIGKGKDEQHCLIDIKEAVAASAPHAADADMPADHAERVVQGARNLSPYLGGRMLATKLLGKSVFVRELLPQDLKLEVETLTREEALNVAGYLAYTVGLAHARQLSVVDRNSWLVELQRNRTKTLDAPSWLWNAVVDLVATHEAAYLQHCRRYAMEEAAAA
ncbi:MAG: DUF2252 family protein [Rhizobium sp.]